MTETAHRSEYSAAAVSTGVFKKTALLAALGAVGALTGGFFLWPDQRPWLAPLGVVFGAALGVINFRWLAFAVERLYLRAGAVSVLSNAAAVVVSILKLSLIFVVLYVVIKFKIVHIIGLVLGFSLCFLSILWQGLALMAQPEDGGPRGTGRTEK